MLALSSASLANIVTHYKCVRVCARVCACLQPYTDLALHSVDHMAKIQSNGGPCTALPEEETRLNTPDFIATQPSMVSLSVTEENAEDTFGFENTASTNTE